MRPLKERSDGSGLSAWIRDPDGHESNWPNAIHARNPAARESADRLDVVGWE